jgi:hypothetical protein
MIAVPAAADVLIVPRHDNPIDRLEKAINECGRIALQVKAERDEQKKRLTLARVIISQTIGLINHGRLLSAQVELDALSKFLIGEDQSWERIKS